MTQQPNQSNLEESNEPSLPQEVENQNEGANPEEIVEEEIDYKAEAERLRSENERIKQQKLNDLTNPNNLSQLQQRERAQADARLHNTNLRIEDLDAEAIDGLSLSQYDAVIRKRLQSLYADITTNKVLPLKKEREKDEVNSQIREAAGKYSDFWDYQVQMVELARLHPSLNADKVYKLAKAEAGKLGTVDEKAIEERVKKKIVTESKAGISAKPGSTVSGTRKSFKKMTAKEAAQSAYDEVFKGR